MYNQSAHCTRPSADSSPPAAVRTRCGRLFDVDVELLKQSRVLDEMLSKNLVARTDGKLQLDLSEVDGECFEQIVKWLKEHKGQPPPKIQVDPHSGERRWLSVTAFQRRFFESASNEQLEALIMAANFLDIPSLYLHGCQAMAARLKNKPAEEIRRVLRLPDDLSEEEKNSVREASVWCSTD